jgi:hypothetical protein
MVKLKIATVLATWFFLIQSLLAAWGILCAVRGYAFQDASNDILWLPLLVVLMVVTGLAVVIHAINLEMRAKT